MSSKMRLSEFVSTAKNSLQPEQRERDIVHPYLYIKNKDYK